MVKKYAKYGLWLIMALLVMSCHRVVIVVDHVPENTPPDEPLFLVSNINKWDPGDSRYQLILNADSVYQVVLPPGFGKVEYKFTRGDWRSVETDICGRDIDDRVIILEGDDTIHHTIESWHDLFPLHCKEVLLIIDQLPETTPADPDIYFVSDLTSWRLWDKNYLMKLNDKGMYELKIPKRVGDRIEFKFNRGPWSTVETDQFGNDIENRQLVIGDADTVYFQIRGWIDRKQE